MKRLLIVLVTLFAAVNASAQVAVVGGITSASQKIKNVDVRNTNSYHFGVAFKHQLGMGFVYQPEILYNMKDLAIADMQESGARAGYLEGGAQIQWGINLSVIRPYVLAEPYLGYALNASVADRKLTDWTGARRFEYGVGFGFGAELIGHVQISAKYFRNMEKTYSGDGGVSGIAVSAAILF